MDPLYMWQGETRVFRLQPGKISWRSAKPFWRNTADDGKPNWEQLS